MIDFGKCLAILDIASTMDKEELLSVIGTMIDDHAGRNHTDPASLIHELATVSQRINEDLGPMHTKGETNEN